jgi:hypothetical protein
MTPAKKTHPLTLAELGISEEQADIAERLARFPWPAIQAVIDRIEKSGREWTILAVLRELEGRR